MKLPWQRVPAQTGNADDDGATVRVGGLTCTVWKWTNGPEAWAWEIRGSAHRAVWASTPDTVTSDGRYTAEAFGRTATKDEAVSHAEQAIETAVA